MNQHEDNHEVDIDRRDKDVSQLDLSSRRFALPPSLSEWLRDTALGIDSVLGSEQRQNALTLKTLAKEIVGLSESYGSQSTKGLFHSTERRRAYLAYFFPLNYLRCLAVISEGEALGFFKGLNSWVDFGAGVGTASVALASHFAQSAGPAGFNHTLIDRESWAVPLYLSLMNKLGLPAGDYQLVPHQKSVGGKLGVFSYSLNELSKLPREFLEMEALFILEPSTQGAARSLMKLREELKQNGFSLWAPCPHQDQCPLLLHSKRDWCHDRIFVDMPEWYLELEEHLPMKNRTLTFSYLLARKAKSPIKAGSHARVIGDTQKEKGKVRQAICRSEKREFFSWLLKNGKPPSIPHGSLYPLPEELTEVGNELRL